MNRRSFFPTLAKTFAGVALGSAAAVASIPKKHPARLQSYSVGGSLHRYYRWSDRPNEVFYDLEDALRSRQLTLADLPLVQ